MEKKLGPTDFEAKIKALQAAGKMPQLEDLLSALADSREKYASKILDARKQGEDKDVT